MKKRSVSILTLLIWAAFTTLGSAQTAKRELYTPDWEQVDLYKRQGFPQTADSVAMSVYAKAKANANYVQTIKAALHHAKFTVERSEDGIVDAYLWLQTAMDASKIPTERALLQSYTAAVLWEYFMQRQHIIRRRSTTIHFKKTDVATWSSDDFIQTARMLYMASLNPKQVLQTTPTKTIEPLLLNFADADVSLRRPTLYDVLAHRAIQFLWNDYAYLNKPAYQFQIDNPEMWGDAATFCNVKLETNDSSNYKRYALKVLQDLTAFHLANRNHYPLVEDELTKLTYLKYNYYEPSNRDNLYNQALTRLYESNVGKITELYMAYIWAINKSEGSSNTFIQHQNPNNRIAEAYAFLKKAVEKNPTALEITVAQNQLCSWEAKTIGLQHKFNVPPNTPILARFSYKNTNKMYIRVVPFGATERKAFIKKEAEMNGASADRRSLRCAFVWDSLIVAMPYIRTTTHEWVMNPDMGSHSFEHPIEGLPTGQYLLLVSMNEDFAPNNTNFIYHSALTVSDLNYLIRPNPNKLVNQIIVVNTTTGKPIEGAKVVPCMVENISYPINDDINLRYPTYSRLNRAYDTDKNGMVEIPYLNEFRAYSEVHKVDTPYYGNGYQLEISKGRDTFIHENRLENVFPAGKNIRPPFTEHIESHLFLDRAIYRPGQTVYFKGINYKRKEKENVVCAECDSNVVQFYNANRESIKTFVLDANEYGSYEGHFVLPTSGMNGTFSINTNRGGGLTFRVEDYKRPKFEADFLPLKGNFKLGKTVKITGNAMNFAGNPLQDATVKFNVIRTISYPYWSYCRRDYPQPSFPSMQIKTGTVHSDAAGNFTIEFLTKADSAILQSDFPMYQYQITADVIDLSGETHSIAQNFNIHPIDIQVNFDLSGTLDLERPTLNGGFASYSIRSYNSNGHPTACKGKIHFYKLENNKRFTRARTWDRPDEFPLSEAAFKAIFPYDEYQKERSIQDRKRTDSLFTIAFSTDTNFYVNLFPYFKNLPAGAYVYDIVTQDSFGTPYLRTVYFTLQNSLKNEFAEAKPIDSDAKYHQQYKVGAESSVHFNSTEKVWVLVEISKNHQEPTMEWVEMNQERKTLNYKHGSEIASRHDYEFTCIYQGQIFKSSSFLITNNPVIDPNADKRLNVVYSTFRNKLVPGQKEVWRIQIQDGAEKPVSAEVLAAMYDGSLDAIARNSWNEPQRYTPEMDQESWDLHYNRVRLRWNSSAENSSNARYSAMFRYLPHYTHCSFKNEYYVQLPQLNFFGIPMNYHRYHGFGSSDGRVYDMNIQAPSGAFRGMSSGMDAAAFNIEHYMVSETPYLGRMNQKLDPMGRKMQEEKALPKLPAFLPSGENQASKPDGDAPTQGKMQVRKNFKETAFFLPQLRTNEKGEILIEFTAPEALTNWHLMLLAHTKTISVGHYTRDDIVTQKELMVFPNMPRFLREGDKMSLATKISNLSDTALTGNAQLLLFDATTMQSIDASFKNLESMKRFQCGAKGSTMVRFDIEVPFGVSAVVYRIVADNGAFSDGEENVLPILSNRMLVTETLPLPVRGGQAKAFVFEKLKNHTSKTLRNHSLTLEVTSNPVWYAIQALPYLMEYPYDCSEQTFSRIYANSLATEIANSQPEIKKIFEQWKKTKALESNLEKNQEVKNILLEETPWVREAKDEQERKNRLGILFDLERMNNEYDISLQKLAGLQLGNGGFVWFKGDKVADRYITQHIVTGFGKLDHLKVQKVRKDNSLWAMLNRAIAYLDAALYKDYLDTRHRNGPLSAINCQYFYTRSFFKDVPVNPAYQGAFDTVRMDIANHWLDFGNYEKGLIALSEYRSKNDTLPKKILRSLQEHAIEKEEMGMYWGNTQGYYWHQAPIETQALMIEAFDEIARDVVSVDAMRTWLIKNKQTNDWKTTRATVEAIYALLLRGTDYLSETKPLQVQVGKKKIMQNAQNREAGTGYYKQVWSADSIQPEMATVQITNPNKVVAFGAMYWQYLEDLDKITPAETPLKLEKKLFLKTISDKGEVITPITPETELKVGDLVKVRIELRVDRPMEYIHLKDMRAAGFEPLNILSQYKWQDGLGYYESTRDAATHFFIRFMARGTYVFEYPLRIAQKGNMSNGITQIQCMYAPEFSAHSEGIRVNVK